MVDVDGSTGEFTAPVVCHDVKLAATWRLVCIHQMNHVDKLSGACRDDGTVNITGITLHYCRATQLC